MSDQSHTRRRYLKLAGTAAAVGLAGCTSSSDDSDTPTDEPAGNDSLDDSSGLTGTENSSQDPSNPENGTTAEGEVTPHDQGSVHMHGFLTFHVNGESVDYDASRFYESVTGNKNFHFHDYTDNEKVTHVHAKGVTVHYALNSLPGITIGDPSQIKINGTTYDTSDAETSVEVTVSNEQVDMKKYVLKERDHIEVLITTSGSSGSGTNGTQSNGTDGGDTSTSGEQPNNDGSDDGSAYQ